MINTSYLREYIVVSASDTEVVLRPVNPDGVMSTYWKEFLSAELSDGAPVPAVRLTYIPSEVSVVSAYVDYVIEYPRVEIIIGDQVIDMSDQVSCNKPNPETPGLYAIDFMLSLPGAPASTIWRSWVSIEEQPLLRHIITPWNRSNRIIADLNRLVMEPRFLESLYESGVPVYNFRQGNAIAAVHQSKMGSYKGSRSFSVGGRLFIGGPRLPSGTVAVVDGVRYVLGLPALVPPYKSGDTYSVGDMVLYCGANYLASEPVSGIAPGTETPNPWVMGYAYESDGFTVPDGELNLVALWAPVDLNGYVFKMDLLSAPDVHNYWGYYNRKYFYDYGTGDLVSIVRDNVMYLYMRNDTSSEAVSTEDAYRPGDYRNPHWIEVYSADQAGWLREPSVQPYGNSTNAFVSKTCTIREEAFRIYADLVGMPSELVDALGPKYSVLLWAILYRTRQTYQGFKAAVNAMGLSLQSLYRVCPSIEYMTGNTPVNTIGEEIRLVKELAKSVQADKVWTGENNPTERLSDPPWIRYKNSDTVERYNPETGTWSEYYKFSIVTGGIGSGDFTKNNRYYRAELGLMERLGKDCYVDLGDDKSWMKPEGFDGISYTLGALMSYEVPIYIYLKMQVHLASIGTATRIGVTGGCSYMGEWGGDIEFRLYPGKLFDPAMAKTREYYPDLQYSVDGSTWELYEDYISKSDYRLYRFAQPVYIKAEYSDTSVTATGWWTSRHTIGCLGDPDSTANDFNFIDASEMGPDDALFLFNGAVGACLMVTSGSVDVTAEVLKWNYAFDGTWNLDETTPFAGWGPITCIVFGNVPSAAYLMANVTRVTSPECPLSYTVDSGYVYIAGGVPRTVYLWNGDSVMVLLQFEYTPGMVTTGETNEYCLRLTFS